MRRIPRRSARLLLLAALPALAAACSVSYSFEKFSDSSSASSNSSESSWPSGRQRAYQGEVSDYTAAYVKSSTDLSAFQSGIGDLARKGGVSDWESDTHTWLGIGAGLGRARVSKLELHGYATNLAGGDPDHVSAIEMGYEAAN